MNQAYENSWMYLVFFIIAWFGFFGLVLPLLDEYLFHYAVKGFLCDNGFTFPTNSSKIWCNIR